jgi:hypothetical protein
VTASCELLGWIRSEGIIFAWKKKDFFNPLPDGEIMNSTPNQNENRKDGDNWALSLETLIAMGLFGWLALSMTLMGLGIW